MNRGNWRRWVVPSLFCWWTVGVVHAEITQSDRDLVERVSRRLLAVTDPVADYTWPPKFRVLDDKNIDARSFVEEGHGKALPKVEVTSGTLHQVIQGHPDRLAFVLGHELGHVILRHLVRKPRGQTPFVQTVFSREQEIAADGKGIELALQAGYSRRRALKGIQRMIDLGLEYSSIEGLGADHPSWSERMTFLSKDQATLWRTMCAFHDGTYFLLCEQYASAERCFREVTREFPDCYEAWANLGDALLMRYCDSLGTSDLRRFDIGQLVIGGFYLRPGSLKEKIRGVNEELWRDAVAALREALRLKPTLFLAKANLGVAYLVSPAGKDVNEAERYLDEAAKAAEEHKDLNPLMRAAVLINAGVADLASGHPDVGVRRLDQGEQIGLAFAGNRSEPPVPPALSPALLYNRALLLAGSPEEDTRRAAVTQIERYLKITSSASTWWPLAYERYAAMCKKFGLPVKDEADLKRASHSQLRPLTEVELKDGVTVSLDEPLTEITDRLGQGEAVPVVAGTDLARRHYARQGIDLLSSDRILAICLRGPESPVLRLRDKGLGAGATVLHVGTSRSELEKIFEDGKYDFRELDTPDVRYRFYPELGLAVKIRGGKVEELVVTRTPRHSMPFSQ
ncbi:MAG: M48 family metalloprotease [Isosphaeraceae bacterium]